MRGLVIFLLILVTIASFSFVAVSINSDMSEIAKAHTLTLQLKASQRFPSMLKNTPHTLVRSVFDIKDEKVEIKNPDYVEFKTFTSAVCEEKNEFVYCRDELFVNCNGKISKSGEIEECNGINIDNFKVTGSAVFEKNWKDPRI